jgi:Astacin (Peptidase family M12A)/Chitobiase/beta-hexosaminidase C-terminal domain/Divergent InlB B-repeat domain
MRLPIQRFVLVVFVAGLLSWAPSAVSQQGRAMLPPSESQGTGVWRGEPVHYVMKNGLPIYQGDIILDNLITGTISGSSSPEQPESVSLPRTLGIIYSNTLWPIVSGVHQIPYIITNDTANVDAAIAQFNTTFSGLIQWVPRTTQTDYVDFLLNPADMSGGGESYIGRIGGEQFINCAINCSVSVMAHEMGHSTGLYHEQSRSDRNTYVTVNYSHLQAGPIANDAIATDNDWIYGPYDFASVMEYDAFSLSADGSQTIQSIPAGIPLSNQTYYTTADIDTIRRIYGAAPTSVTVDTNPTGLQVVVDGATVTTPQTYSWALNSAHTLAIPAGIASSGLQAQGQLDYQFGAWNDGGAASHMINITPGSGMPGYPPTSPAQTVYTANFIQWVPYSPMSTSFPPGAGTVTTTPAPTTFAGVGQFFLADLPVSFHGNPNSGYNFFNWYGSFSCNSSCYFSLTANPLNLNYWVTSGIQPGFTTSQVTTIATNPPGLDIQVDGKDYTSPVSFSPAPSINGSAWAAGTSHFINAPSPQSLFSANTSYVWSNWSDALSVSHSFTVAPGNSTITANYTTQVGLALTTNSTCAGTVAANPPGPSNAGTPVQFTATPNSGFVFSQWEGGLSGSVNPLTVPVNQEQFVQADFNTIAAPLTITSISPTSVGAGSPPFALTINGTGFVPAAGVGGTGSYANILYEGNYDARPLTYISPTQLQIPVTAAEVAYPGALQVVLQNSVLGACAITANAQLAVSPALVPTTSGFSPASATVGGSTFMLTVNGAGFASGATVKWNGTALATSFVNTIQLTATVPNTLIAAIGTAGITVANPDGKTSTPVTFSITAYPPTATPLFSLAAGVYAGTQMVMLSDASSGAAIYYTTNGTLPTTASTLYVTPITVSSSETIEAIAVASGFSQSAVASAAYTIPALAQSAVFLNGNGTVESFGPGGTAGIPATGGGGLSAGAPALAIDGGGHIWIAGTSDVAEFDKSGNSLSGSGYIGGGLGGAGNAATGIAVDGQGYIWVTNSNGSLTWLNNSGSALSPSSGFTGGGMSSPSAAAIDNAGTVWVTNSGNNSITRVFGAASPATVPLATGVTNGTLGTRP